MLSSQAKSLLLFGILIFLVFSLGVQIFILTLYYLQTYFRLSVNELIFGIICSLVMFSWIHPIYNICSCVADIWEEGDHAENKNSAIRKLRKVLIAGMIILAVEHFVAILFSGYMMQNSTAMILFLAGAVVVVLLMCFPCMLVRKIK